MRLPPYPNKSMENLPPPKTEHEELLDALWTLNLLGCHYEVKWRNMIYARRENSTEEFTVKADN